MASGDWFASGLISMHNNQALDIMCVVVIGEVKFAQAKPWQEQ